MGAPWTRDGAVRAYVVTIAPEVDGRIVELPVADNQFVHKRLTDGVTRVTTRLRSSSPMRQPNRPRRVTRSERQKAGAS
jgi:Biotin-lipoyl like